MRKGKKTSKATGTANRHDLFTALCRSDFRVECVKEYQFHPKRKWRFDYAIPEHKIALEVEGGVYIQGRHTRPAGFLGDMQKYNIATLMGWRVFRTTPDSLYGSATLELIKTAVFGGYDPENDKKLAKK